MKCQDLITENMGLVWHVARKFQRTAKFLGFDLDDIMQEGVIGLVKAAKKFDESRGTVFSTYATRCIQNEILMSFRKRRRWQEHYRSISIETPFSEDGKLRVIDTLGYDQDFNSDVFLIEFLKRLPDRYKTIMRLRLSGLTHQEIAEKIGLSQSYVTKLIIRIQHKYRKEVQMG
jgi:RNA polymerase sporulation-specific sigma factor